MENTQINFRAAVQGIVDITQWENTKTTLSKDTYEYLKECVSQLNDFLNLMSESPSVALTLFFQQELKDVKARLTVEEED